MNSAENEKALAEVTAYVNARKEYVDDYLSYLKAYSSGEDAHMFYGHQSAKNLFPLPTMDICSMACADEEPENLPDGIFTDLWLDRYASLACPGAMYQWKLSKNIYLVDRDALRAILTAPMPEELTPMHFVDRFREFCMYVSFGSEHYAYVKTTDGSTVSLLGFFIGLDGDLYSDGYVAIHGVPVTEFEKDGYYGSFLRIFPNDELFSGINKKIGEEMCDTKVDDLPISGADRLNLARLMLKLTAFILSDNHDVLLNGAEIDWNDRDSMYPKAKKVKGGYRVFPLDRTAFYMAGGKLGAEVRRKLSEGTAPAAIQGHFTAEIKKYEKYIEDNLSFTLD